MSFPATVLRVVIASPSDAFEARDAVEAALWSWNESYASARKIVLLPWRWETSAIPVLGGHPQEILNEQGIDKADIVVAIFWTRLGMPTLTSASGTAEEIQRSLENGKPVHLYLSKQPIPNDGDTDIEQLQKLRDFTEEIRSRGLLGEFETLEQLKMEIWKAIDHDIANINVPKPNTSNEPLGVRLLVHSRSEREQQGLDKRGNMKYRTRHWFEIENAGDRDAEEVTFSQAPGSGNMHLVTPELPVRIQAGTIRKVPVALFWESADLKLQVDWIEEGKPKSEEFDVQ